MKWILRSLVLLLAVPATTSGQALPQWSAEVAAGLGPRTSRVGETFYSGEHSAVAQVALDYRLLGGPRTAIYLKGEANPALMHGDRLSICGIAPNGSCYQDFENNDGVTGALVVRHAIARLVVLGAFVGVGRYNDHVRSSSGGELILSDGQHVGLYVSARYQQWSRQGARYWFAPVSLGVQLF